MLRRTVNSVDSVNSVNSVNSVDSVNIDTQNHQVTDYKDERSSPPKEYQNRKANTGNVTRNLMMNKRKSSSERDKKNRSRKGSGSGKAEHRSRD